MLNTSSRGRTYFAGSLMTIETPLHRQRLGLPGKRHQIHPAMASRTAHAAVHMNTVIEINEFGKIVNARPFDGPAGPIALAHGLQRGAGRPHFLMTVHADLGCRNVGERRNLYSVMAVTAIDTKPSHVMLMAERHRLLPRYILRGFVWRSHNHRSCPKNECQRAQNR